ncbi:MAG: AmmeMemoRadiSam system protein B, partial [Anaerolineae bacterium]
MAKRRNLKTIGCTLFLLLALLLGACRPAEQDTPKPTAQSTPETTAPSTPSPWPTPRPTEGFSEVRPAAVAGAFYPTDADQATEMVDQYLAPVRQVDGQPIALIVPHAAWVYSGQVAAVAYKQIEGLKYDAVVIIGPYHSASSFDAISVYAEGAFETPLGPLPVDETLAAQLLAAHERIVFERGVHRQEHSIEVQLPFLQRVCPDCAFVPVLIGQPTPENLDILTQALSEALQDKRALIIASSDLSHYPTYDDAMRVDTATLATIETLDSARVSAVIADQMAQGVPGLGTCACGEGPILVTMRVAQALGADHVRVLYYANSGDVSGDLSRVVGYGAVMFWRWQPPEHHG